VGYASNESAKKTAAAPSPPSFLALVLPPQSPRRWGVLGPLGCFPPPQRLRPAAAAVVVVVMVSAVACPLRIRVLGGGGGSQLVVPFVSTVLLLGWTDSRL
jgi:hypothetical protein